MYKFSKFYLFSLFLGFTSWLQTQILHFKCCELPFLTRAKRGRSPQHDNWIARGYCSNQAQVSQDFILVSSSFWMRIWSEKSIRKLLEGFQSTLIHREIMNLLKGKRRHWILHRETIELVNREIKSWNSLVSLLWQSVCILLNYLLQSKKSRVLQLN